MDYLIDSFDEICFSLEVERLDTQEPQQTGERVVQNDHPIEVVLHEKAHVLQEWVFVQQFVRAFHSLAVRTGAESVHRVSVGVELEVNGSRYSQVSS